MKLLQLLPTFAPADAIGNHSRLLREWANHHNIQAEIYARVIHDTNYQILPLESFCPEPDDVVIYHYSIGGETQVDALFCQHSGPKVFWYHNLTPAYFFYPYSTDIVSIVNQGRGALPDWATKVDLAVADSQFNADELIQVGFAQVFVAPPIGRNWDVSALPEHRQLRQKLRKSPLNLLFVGRIVPNKRQEDLVRLLRWVVRFYQPQARLFLVGDNTSFPDYIADIKQVIADCNLQEQVWFSGKVTDRELTAIYRASDIFVCLSAHEGFCVPIIEAMAYQLPVLALQAGAVTDTLGQCGIQLTNFDPAVAAAAVARLQSDSHLRRRIINRQNARLLDFSASSVSQQLDNIFRTFLKFDCK